MFQECFKASVNIDFSEGGGKPAILHMFTQNEVPLELIKYITNKDMLQPEYNNNQTEKDLYKE